MSQIDVVGQLDVADVDLQNRLPADQVGAIDDDGAIESAGPQQGGVERFGPIGRRHDDDAAIGIEAVHLDEQLVERLFAFIVAADGCCRRGSCPGRPARR